MSKKTDTIRRGDLFAPAWHRPWLRYVDTVDGAGGGDAGGDGAGSEAPATDADDKPLGEGGIRALKAEREGRAAEKARADALAAKLQEIEDRDKSEAEKAQERLVAAEKRAAELEMKALRVEVAAAKGVPVELLNGGTQEELEASADALIAFKGAQAKGPVIPNQGKTPANNNTGTPADRFAAQLDAAGL